MDDVINIDNLSQDDLFECLPSDNESIVGDESDFELDELLIIQ